MKIKNSLSSAFEKYTKLQVIVFILIILISSSIFPQHKKPLSPHRTVEKKRSGWVAAPYITYAPETGFVFGAAGIYYFYMDTTITEDTKPSDLNVNFMYSTKKQIHLAVPFFLALDESTYKIIGRLVAEKYPFKFYGIGNSTIENDEEDYTPITYGIDVSFVRKIFYDYLNAGLHLDFRYDKIIKVEENKSLDMNSIPGASGGTVFGLGIDIDVDKRDNNFNPFNGGYLDLKATFYNDIWGSDFNFARYFIDARKYFPLKFGDDTHVFAIQSVFDVTSGKLPFYSLPTFGGDLSMRGFFLGRYRDNLSAYLQMDYRFPVWWRIGAILFGSTGQVSNGFNHLAIDRFKFAGGFGLRFNVIPDERMAARFDLGFSKDGLQFYITFGEAF